MKGIRIMILILVLLTTPVVYAAYDQWGYNYQANIYNGWYDNYLKPAVPNEHQRGDLDGIWLQMKWNDAWLDEDGNRHEGFPSYDGSGAWLTNHMIGWYEEDGKVYQWEYFVKIVATSTADGDYVDNGYWYNSEGVEIGPVIWGQFAVIQEQEMDRGINWIYQSPLGPGLG